MIRRFAFAALILGAVACGDDSSDGDDKKPTDNKPTPADASTTPAYVPTKNAVTNVGAACKTASDCTGAKPECQTSLSVLVASINYPGGQCTAGCQEDSECGGGANDVCPLGPLLALGGGAGGIMLPISPTQISKCQKKCTSDADCRTGEGYRCATLSAAFPQVGGLFATLGGAAMGGDAGAAGGLAAGLNQTFCFPPAPPMPEAGAGDAGVADASAADASAADAAPDAAPDAAQ